MERYTQRALIHIRTLSETIGGRGSCTQEERQAASYVYKQLCEMGIHDACVEPFRGSPSTYRPYLLAFAAALLGTILALFAGSRPAMAAAAVLNALGVWAMLAETDFRNHWARWLLPRANSQNVVGVLPPAGPTRRRAVLCAHLDTHRTPVFYSSQTWHRLFGLLVLAAFLSMAAGALVFGAGALTGWSWLRWAAWLVAPMQGFALAMVSTADLTPFSPGANDNASGVGVILSLAERLVDQPLSCTEIHLAFTGCEETASYGFLSYLNAHADQLGKDTFYIVLDEVGLGRIKFLSADGLIWKHKTHPRALDLARRVAADLPELEAMDCVGMAYTDALPATQRGLVALSISSAVPSTADSSVHWHQMSDRLEYIDPQSLSDAHQFAWRILQLIDQGVWTGERA